jgi:hypothetical protein
LTFYVYLHDADAFRGRVLPLLGACRRRRSFAPARPLLFDLVPAAQSFRERFAPGGGPLLIEEAAAGAAFDVGRWKLLVGEVLLVGAADVPLLPAVPETLDRVLPADLLAAVTLGPRPLEFAGMPYRPGAAGWADPAEAAALADALDARLAAGWEVAALEGVPGLDDPAEESADLAEWLAGRVALLRGATARNQAVVGEAG